MTLLNKKVRSPWLRQNVWLPNGATSKRPAPKRLRPNGCPQTAAPKYPKRSCPKGGAEISCFGIAQGRGVARLNIKRRQLLSTARCRLKATNFFRSQDPESQRNRH